MIVYKCDKCKKEIETDSYIGINKYDLCIDCGHDISSFVTEYIGNCGVQVLYDRYQNILKQVEGNL